MLVLGLQSYIYNLYQVYDTILDFCPNVRAGFVRERVSETERECWISEGESKGKSE